METFSHFKQIHCQTITTAPMWWKSLDADLCRKHVYIWSCTQLSAFELAVRRKLASKHTPAKFFACLNSRQAKLPLFRQQASVSSVQLNGCEREDYKIRTHTSCLCRTSADPRAPYNCCENKIPSRQFVSKSSSEWQFSTTPIAYFCTCCNVQSSFVV